MLRPTAQTAGTAQCAIEPEIVTKLQPAGGEFKTVECQLQRLKAPDEVRFQDVVLCLGARALPQDSHRIADELKLPGALEEKLIEKKPGA